MGYAFLGSSGLHSISYHPVDPPLGFDTGVVGIVAGANPNLLGYSVGRIGKIPGYGIHVRLYRFHIPLRMPKEKLGGATGPILTRHACMLTPYHW